MQGLESLPKLRVLDVSSNQVKDVTGLETLSHITDLWLNDNAITSLADLEVAAGGPLGGTLKCLYLAGNPAAESAGGHADYRDVLTHMFPQLEQLDDELVSKS